MAREWVRRRNDVDETTPRSFVRCPRRSIFQSFLSPFLFHSLSDNSITSNVILVTLFPPSISLALVIPEIGLCKKDYANLKKKFLWRTKIIIIITRNRYIISGINRTLPRFVLPISTRPPCNFRDCVISSKKKKAITCLAFSSDQSSQLRSLCVYIRNTLPWLCVCVYYSLCSKPKTHSFVLDFRVFPIRPSGGNKYIAGMKNSAPLFVAPKDD